MGLGWHPGEAEALPALGHVPGLDGAHLERGDALHLRPRDTHHLQPTLVPPRPKSQGQPGVGRGSALPPQTARGQRALQPHAAPAGDSLGTGTGGTALVGTLTLQITCLWKGPSRREQRTVRTGASSPRGSVAGAWLSAPRPCPATRPTSVRTTSREQETREQAAAGAPAARAAGARGSDTPKGARGSNGAGLPHPRDLPPPHPAASMEDLSPISRRPAGTQGQTGPRLPGEQRSSRVGWMDLLKAARAAVTGWSSLGSHSWG